MLKDALTLSALIAAVLLVRAAFKNRVPKRLLYALWLVVLLAALGGFNLLLPRASWYLSYGWRYKNAEPSDLVLAINRIGGGAILAVALLLLLL